MELLVQLNQWLQPHKGELSVAVVTTLLVIYGDVLNKYIKRQLRPYHFVVRTCLFVIICTFGYSSLVLLLSPLVSAAFQFIAYPYFPLAVIALAITIGVLAEKRRYI